MLIAVAEIMPEVWFHVIVNNISKRHHDRRCNEPGTELLFALPIDTTGHEAKVFCKDDVTPVLEGEWRCFFSERRRWIQVWFPGRLPCSIPLFGGLSSHVLREYRTIREPC